MMPVEKSDGAIGNSGSLQPCAKAATEIASASRHAVCIRAFTRDLPSGRRRPLSTMDCCARQAWSRCEQSARLLEGVSSPHVTPETAKKLNDLAATSGRAPDDIVEDALAGYLEEVASVRKTLDSRYDDLKSGRVKPIDGEEAFRTARKERAPTIRRMSGYAWVTYASET